MKRMPLPPITTLDAARFWSKVDVSGAKECWLWNGAIGKTGYGHFSLIRARVTYAHRVAYALLKGDMSDGLELDHLCRVRHCVNPEHLEPVTPTTNVLRGESFSAKNAAKTTCPKGHPLAGENLYLKPRKNGKFARVCLICRRYHPRILNYKYRAPGYR